MGSSDELRRLLDELGVEYTTYDTTAYEAVIWTGSVCKWIALPSEYGLAVAVYKDYLTPEQAIAATVDVTEDETDARDLMEAIRDDDGVRYSMDEVLDIMRKDVAATVGNVGYGIEFADWCEFPPETMVGETVFDSEGNAIGWITNSTVGRETLTAEQVRKCVKGVYFEGYGDGATHRVHGIEETDWQNIADKLNATLGAGTCEWCKDGKTFDRQTVMMTNHGWQKIRHCPNCGRKIRED